MKAEQRFRETAREVGAKNVIDAPCSTCAWWFCDAGGTPADLTGTESGQAIALGRQGLSQKRKSESALPFPSLATFRSRPSTNA